MAFTAEKAREIAREVRFDEIKEVLMKVEVAARAGEARVAVCSGILELPIVVKNELERMGYTVSECGKVYVSW